MKVSANALLWQFCDAIVPSEWKSKQARRIYDAAIEAEKSGTWTKHAVSGSVRCQSNRDNVPEIREPQYGTDKSTALIEQMTRSHIDALRRHADRLENVLAAYGGDAFRKRVAQMPAPRHPFDAEAALTSLISDASIDVITVHGVRFVRDASRAFVRADQPHA